MMNAKKILALFMAFALCIGFLPAYAFASNSAGVTYTATLNTASISPSAETQTVVMTVKASKKVDIDAVQLNVTIPSGWAMTGIANADLAMSNADANLNTGAVVWFHPEGDAVNTDIIVEVTYTVPAGVAVGTYDLGVTNLDLFADYGTQWEFDASASAQLTVAAAEPAEIAYNATLNTSEINSEASTQTVVMTVKANKKVDIDAVQLNVIIPDGWTMTGIANADLAMSNADANLNTGAVVWFHPEGDAVNTDIIIEVTYTVPANVAAGTYNLGITNLDLFADYGTQWEFDASASATLTVMGAAVHTCTGTFTKGQAATCTVDGWKDYYACDCGKYYTDSACTDEISDLAAWKTGAGKIAASHDYGTLVAEDPGVHTATEVKNGMKAHYFCDTCDTYFTDAKVATTEADLIIVNAHDYATQYGYKEADGHADTCACGAKTTVVEHTPNMAAPTETEDKVCTLCGFVIDPKTGHIHRNNLTPVSKLGATCTVDGYEAHYKCSCGKYFEDATATTEIEDIDAWKAGAGKIAAEGHNYTEAIKDAAHIKSEAANCTEYDVYWYDCSVCDANAKNDPDAADKFYTSTDAGDHNFDTTQWGYKEDDGHANTCTCGAHNTVIEHTPNMAAPTEDDAVICTACEYVITPALGHIHQNHLTKVDAEPADCENDGNIQYYTCSCGKWFEDATAATEITDKESVKIAGGHEYGTLVEAQGEVHTATELKAAVAAHYFCDECDTYFTAEKVATTLDALTGETPVHNYSTQYGYKEADGHADTCACGAKTTVVEHTPDRAAATEDDAVICTVCEYVITPALGHIHQNHLTKVDAEPADCENDGNTAYYTCSCGKWFEDATATTEITDKESVKIAGGHEYGDLVQEEPAKHTATELAAGMKAHYFCDECDTYFTAEKVATTEAEQVIPAPTHAYDEEFGYVGEDGHADTCTCGAHDTVEPHTYGNEWKHDKKNHWNECICGDQLNVERHVDADENLKCDVCDRDLPTNAETGDSMNLALLVSLMVLSACGVVAIVYGKKRFSVK